MEGAGPVADGIETLHVLAEDLHHIQRNSPFSVKNSVLDSHLVAISLIPVAVLLLNSTVQVQLEGGNDQLTLFEFVAEVVEDLPCLLGVAIDYLQ